MYLVGSIAIEIEMIDRINTININLHIYNSHEISITAEILLNLPPTKQTPLMSGEKT